MAEEFEFEEEFNPRGEQVLMVKDSVETSATRRSFELIYKPAGWKLIGEDDEDEAGEKESATRTRAARQTDKPKTKAKSEGGEGGENDNETEK